MRSFAMANAPASSRHVLGRTISKDTAATLTGIMEQTVERGTATFAQVDGYSIAGKTGTAAKLVNGRYSHTDYFASFVGFLPSRNPVAEHHRRSRFPACARVLRRTDRRSRLSAHRTKRLCAISASPPTFDAPSTVLVARRGERQDIQTVQSVSEPSIVRADGATTDLPDFRGLSAREALKVLTKVGLTARINGSGIVVTQKPAAGTPIEPGTTTELWLERATNQ